jgi:predicted NAD-dependent protein-ADP-ribosyltransferase YbiA (DUF1768 family)
MRVVLKDNLIVLIPSSADEARELETWKSSHATHVLCAESLNEHALELHDLGKRVDACREPINVVSNSPDPIIKMISNFATAPFELDGRHYRSVESFWQGLKFSDDGDRRRLAQLEGPHARAEGEKRGYGATISYGGREIAVGTWVHWQLMERACRAKFKQDREARAALLATGERPLTHVIRRDSTTIPGVIMAEIWMRVRRELRRAVPAGGKDVEPAPPS